MRKTWGEEVHRKKLHGYIRWVGLTISTKEEVHSKQRQKHFQKQGGTVLTHHKMSNSKSSLARRF